MSLHWVSRLERIMISVARPDLKEAPINQAPDLLRMALDDIAAMLSEGLGTLIRTELKKQSKSGAVASAVKEALPQLLERSFQQSLLESASETHLRRVALMHLLTAAEVKTISHEVSLLSAFAHTDEGTDVLTTEEAAKLLNVSRTHLISLVESGTLPASRTSGGHRRIPKAAVLAYKGQMQARQRKGLDAMMKASGDLGLYHDELEGIPRRSKRTA
jgi:excisionase family DNA binding protein